MVLAELIVNGRIHILWVIWGVLAYNIFRKIKNDRGE